MHISHWCQQEIVPWHSICCNSTSVTWMQFPQYVLANKSIKFYTLIRYLIRNINHENVFPSHWITSQIFLSFCASSRCNFYAFYFMSYPSWIMWCDEIRLVFHAMSWILNEKLMFCMRLSRGMEQFSDKTLKFWTFN